MHYWFMGKAHLRETDISAYLDGMLDGRRAAAAEAHLRDCLRCSRLLSELAAIRSMLAELPRQQASRPLLVPREAAASIRPSMRGSWLVAAPALSLVLLAALLLLDLVAVNGSGQERLAAGDAAVTATLKSADSPAAAPSVQDLPQSARSMAPEQAPSAPQPPPVPSPSANIFVAPSAASDSAAGDDLSSSASAAPGPVDTLASAHVQQTPDDDDIGWLRVLQALAALAFAASAAIFVWNRLAARATGRTTRS